MPLHKNVILFGKAGNGLIHRPISEHIGPTGSLQGRQLIDLRLDYMGYFITGVVD